MGDSSRPVVRNRFKAPEGQYQLLSERTQGLIPFNYQRNTRLTHAQLFGGEEEGSWVIFNVADLVNVSRINATHGEPARSLPLGNSASRTGFPTCHDWAAAKDGIDTLVGLGDGQVLLLSLRTQLQAAPNSKPNIASTLSPEAGSETARCVAVAWLPRTEGMFAAGFSSGNIYLYKKGSLLGDGGSKFLGLGSSSKASSTPASTISISGGGINDVAASPCGTRLAVACRDGAVRVLDVASGAVVAGCQSYYGAMLCCSFSLDGRYVAAGGEDDLVVVYGMQERYPVAHCQGHDSWVSRVRFDASMQLGSGTTTGSAAGTSGGGAVGSAGGAPLGSPEKVYRLVSVAQDAQMCMWDVQVLPMDADWGALALAGAPLAQAGTMRKSSSQANLHSPMRSSGEGPPTAPTHQRKPSVGKPWGSAGVLAPALPHTEMNVVQPTMQHRVHAEPLSDVLFSDTTILTADHGSCIRVWQRPGPGQRSSSMQRGGWGPASMETGE